MPYPHVIQLETRLPVDRVLLPVARPQPLRDHRLLRVALLGLGTRPPRNAGGRRP